MSKLNKEISKDKILAVLNSVVESDNKIKCDVSSIVIKGLSVGFALEVDINNAANYEPLRQRCADAVKSIDGVEAVTAVLTSAASSREPEDKSVINPVIDPNTSMDKRSIAGVKNVIVVASGKGGVGKSTIAVNIARELNKSGYSVGIVDIDIYGPSVPTMLGVSGEPDINNDKKIFPKTKDGIKSISIGYLVSDERAVIWRSSMAIKAMNQLLTNVAWGSLDYLIVDTPPGTGDLHLSLCKNYNVTGAVLVSTPQEVALLDLKKSFNMFNKLDIPILGIVENMSYFEDGSGRKSYIFGRHSVEKFANESGINFLGEVPIRREISSASDTGKNIKNDLSVSGIVTNLLKETE